MNETRNHNKEWKNHGNNLGHAEFANFSGVLLEIVGGKMEGLTNGTKVDLIWQKIDK